MPTRNLVVLTFAMWPCLAANSALAQDTPQPATQPTVSESSCWAEPVSVYFDYDEATIRRDQTDVLDALVACLSSDEPDGGTRYVIDIVGHTDERGTSEYNFALGERYAHAVERYLERAFGEAVAGRIELTSHSVGEEQPLCDDHSEACWRRNRRAEIRVEAAPESAP